MNDFDAMLAGYAHGLSGTLDWDQRQIGDPPIRSQEFARLRLAFLAGLEDGYMRYIRLNPHLFVSPEEAAQIRGVALNNVNIFLRNEKRNADYLHQSLSVGEGKRRVWHLHRDDVAEFPFRAKNKSA